MMAWGMNMTERIELEKSDASYIGYAFWVVVDGYADTPFLPSHPITILHNQQQKMVPFMTGVTSDEGSMLAPSIWNAMEPHNNVVQKNWGWIGGHNLFPGRASPLDWETEQKARMIAHFYVGKEGLVRQNKQGLVDMYTDAYFAAPNTEVVKLHAKVGLTFQDTLPYLPRPLRLFITTCLTTKDHFRAQHSTPWASRS